MMDRCDICLRDEMGRAPINPLTGLPESADAHGGEAIHDYRIAGSPHWPAELDGVRYAHPSCVGRELRLIRAGLGDSA